MARIDLKKSSGFSLFVENGELVSPDLSYRAVKKYYMTDLTLQLLNSDLSYPEDIYFKYFGYDHDKVFASKNLNFNVYFIPQNLAGIEYVKTIAIRSRKHSRILEILYGGGIVILQNSLNKTDDIIISKVKRDQKIIVPKGYALTLINTRQSQLIVGEIIAKEARNSFVLDEMRGMAYYVIRKNAKQEIVRNPNYKDIDGYRRVRWDVVVQKFGITLKTPVIKQILRKYEKFNWLFDETEIQV